MRYIIPAFAAVALAFAPIASIAQTATPAPALGTSQTTTSPAAAPAPAAASTKAHHKLEERFASANTTKDGHLTLEQAKTAKWRMVAKNFDTIDTGHKGYVTQDDIRAASAAHHAAKQAKPAGNG